MDLGWYLFSLIHCIDIVLGLCFCVFCVVCVLRGCWLFGIIVTWLVGSL